MNIQTRIIQKIDAAFEHLEAFCNIKPSGRFSLERVRDYLGAAKLHTEHTKADITHIITTMVPDGYCVELRECPLETCSDRKWIIPTDGCSAILTIEQCSEVADLVVKENGEYGYTVTKRSFVFIDETEEV